MEVGFTMEMHDCSHKFLDDTKTCIQLFLNDHFGNKTSVGYVFANETQEEINGNKEYYLDFLLSYIKENTKWV